MLTHLSLEAVDAWTYLLGLDVVHSLRSACLLRLAGWWRDESACCWFTHG